MRSCTTTTPNQATTRASEINTLKTFAPAGKLCPLCGDIGSYVGTCHDYAVRECTGPHLGSQRHAPILLSWQWADEAQYFSLYQNSDYHTDIQRNEGQPTVWERDADHFAAAHLRLGWLENIKRGGKLVDVGCGAGVFVTAAKARGFDAMGFEPDHAIAGAAAAMGRKVVAGNWKNLDMFFNEPLDVITLHDVWEHLTQPVAFLDTARRALAHDGVLVIEIPEWRCPDAVVEGMSWKHIRPLQHVFLPSDGAAREIFERCGFLVEAAVRPMRGRLGKIAYYLTPAR